MMPQRTVARACDVVTVTASSHRFQAGVIGCRLDSVDRDATGSGGSVGSAGPSSVAGSSAKGGRSDLTACLLLAIASAVSHPGRMKVDELREVAKAQTSRVATIGEFIREQRQVAQVSLRQLSKLAGVSNPYLSQIERGLRKPSAEILQQIAKGLRISAEQLYMHAGILEDRVPSDLVMAVLADPELDERQKNLLIEIYQSFRRENATG
jgi:transcriptional regulator with XRE-family HTH domain